MAEEKGLDEFAPILGGKIYIDQLYCTTDTITAWLEACLMAY